MERSLNFPQKTGRRYLVLILAAFGLLTFTYSLLLPLGEAADEAEHFALIRFIADQRRPPLSLKEQHAISAKGDASPIYHSLVALLTQHVEVSELPDLPDPRHRLERAIPYDRLPFKGLYHTEDEAWPFRGIVLAWHLARLVSIPLALATIVAIYLTVATIYPRRPYFALAAAGFAAFIPRFVINSAIVSDDNLVLPLITFSIYFLARIIQGDQRPGRFVALGLLMGLAAIAKYHSLILLPQMTIVLLILAWRNPGHRSVWLRRWGLTMLAFLLISGWWFAFMLIQFNQVEQLGWLRGLIAPLGDPVIAEGIDQVMDTQAGSSLGYEAELGWLAWGDLLFRTFWFRYGRGHVIEHPLVNGALGLLALAAGLGLLFLGLRRWQQFGSLVDLSKSRHLVIALLALHFLLYLALVVARYLSLPTRETAQGRHLFPALVAIAFFFVLGWSQILRLWPRRSPTSHKALALGLSTFFFGFSLITLPIFVMPVYYPYLPIQTITPEEAPIQHRLKTSFAPGLNFEGYSLEPQTEGPLAITLYWYAEAGQARDYLVRVCLYDQQARPVTCRQGHPADGRYPMRAWEVGYLIRDQVVLPVPACLPTGDYELRLAVLPLRLDTPSTVLVDSTAVEPLSLGWVTLSGSPPEQMPDFELWAGGERHSRGPVELAQIRQGVTVITYSRQVDRPLEASYSAAGTGSAATWLPVPPEILYRCPDGTVASTHNFIVDPAVKPGPYHLVVGEQVKPAPLANVRTRPRNFTPPANLAPPLNLSFDGQIALLGYELNQTRYLPGETVDIQMVWQSLTTMRHRYVGSLHLLDRMMTMQGQVDHILGNNFQYPNLLWAPGEIVTDLYQLPIHSQAPPGLYTLEFGVYHLVSGEFRFLPVATEAGPEPVKHLQLGQVRVLDPDHVTAPSHPLSVELGRQIELLGYDLVPEEAAPGESLRLTLHWQAIDPPTTDYTVFTQLVGPDGLVWAQQDNHPQAGRYPTTAWSLQDKVVDRYNLTVPQDAPAGQYRLLVGMYDLATGQRLPALDDQGIPLPDDAILLTVLNVREK